MPHMLRDALLPVLSSEELSRVYSAFDVIGSIVIIKIPDDLGSKRSIIAEALLKNIKNAKGVFAQTSAVSGEYRIRELEFLAGENTTVTEYKENGCRFKVDVARAYFSPRLSTERERISNLVEEGERVVNMFGGVGTFSIQIAKKSRTSLVHNVDSNPAAAELCDVNAKLNRVQDRVVSICGEAAEVIRTKLAGQCDRVLMPLPELAREFVDDAVSALDKRGMVHYFAHLKSEGKTQARDDAAGDAHDAFRNYTHKLVGTRVVREVGPRLYQTVADVYVEKA